MHSGQKRILAVAGAIIGLGGLIVLFASLYTLDQTQQAVVLQFGKPVGDPVTEPGLHIKLPFLQEVRVFEKRLLSWDGDPNQIPTRGREFISIDTTARWRIVDALQFLKSVRDETGAQSRLDDIIDSVVRDMVSSTELIEIVRSGDWSVSGEDLERADVLAGAMDEDALVKEVKVGRNQLIHRILKEASKDMPAKYGIELADVRIKRLNYITSVRKQVFNRMISERQRIAEQFRSEGQGEASRIRGETSRQLAEIQSEARREAEVIRGEADAEATRIYNEAFKQDPEFYAFSRTLESYAKVFGKGTTLVLGMDSEFLKYLKDIHPAAKR